MSSASEDGRLFINLLLEGNYLCTGVVSVTLNFHPQGRNVNDVTNEGKS